MTIGDVARRAGLPLDTVRKLEAGRRRLRVTTALRLARALGIEVEDLVGGRDVD
jgi:transcriptional regulator with XRE-family HTH domain